MIPGNLGLGFNKEDASLKEKKEIASEVLSPKKTDDVIHAVLEGVFPSMKQDLSLHAKKQPPSLKDRKVSIAEKNEAKRSAFITVGKTLNTDKDGDAKAVESQFTAIVDKALAVDKTVQPYLISIGNTKFFVHRQGESLKIYKSGDVLGKGSFGIATGFHKIVGDTSAVKRVLKEAISEGSDASKAREDVENEYKILREIHREGTVKGIQQAPIAFLKHSSSENGIVGYLTRPYEKTLNETTYASVAFDEKLKNCEELLEGLKLIQEKGYFHSDIKPGNCCIEDGEAKIADWGGARKGDKINFLKPLGTFTPFYTNDIDYEEANEIAARYLLHLSAAGQVYPIKNTDIALDIWVTAYLEVKENKDQYDERGPGAFQLAMDSVLGSISQETAEIALGYIDSVTARTLAEEEMEEIIESIADKETEISIFMNQLEELNSIPDEKKSQKNSVDVAQISHWLANIQREVGLLELQLGGMRAQIRPLLDTEKGNRDQYLAKLEEFKMDPNEIEQLTDRTQALCKRHDAYSMTVTILEILSGKNLEEDFSEEHDNGKILMAMLGSLSQINRVLSDKIYSILLAGSEGHASVEVVAGQLNLGSFIQSTSASSSSSQG